MREHQKLENYNRDLNNKSNIRKKTMKKKTIKEDKNSNNPQ